MNLHKFKTMKCGCGKMFRDDGIWTKYKLCPKHIREFGDKWWKRNVPLSERLKINKITS